MKVYVLLGVYDYEGCSVIGVFSSEEKAEAYRDKAIKERLFCYDDYEIEEEDVDSL